MKKKGFLFINFRMVRSIKLIWSYKTSINDISGCWVYSIHFMTIFANILYIMYTLWLKVIKVYSFSSDVECKLLSLFIRKSLAILHHVSLKPRLSSESGKITFPGSSIGQNIDYCECIPTSLCMMFHLSVKSPTGHQTQAHWKTPGL